MYYHAQVSFELILLLLKSFQYQFFFRHEKRQMVNPRLRQGLSCSSSCSAVLFEFVLQFSSLLEEMKELKCKHNDRVLNTLILYTFCVTDDRKIEQPIYKDVEREDFIQIFL